MTPILSLEEGGKITLPDRLRAQYHITAETPIRLVETSGGILLVPLTNEPMSAELVAELEAWQSHAAETFGRFIYADRRTQGIERGWTFDV